MLYKSTQISCIKQKSEKPCGNFGGFFFVIAFSRVCHFKSSLKYCSIMCTIKNSKWTNRKDFWIFLWYSFLLICMFYTTVAEICRHLQNNRQLTNYKVLKTIQQHQWIIIFNIFLPNICHYLLSHCIFHRSLHHHKTTKILPRKWVLHCHQEKVNTLSKAR